jgi:hypothetical protein
MAVGFQRRMRVHVGVPWGQISVVRTLLKTLFWLVGWGAGGGRGGGGAEVGGGRGGGGRGGRRGRASVSAGCPRNIQQTECLIPCYLQSLATISRHRAARRHRGTLPRRRAAALRPGATLGRSAWAQHRGGAPP